MGLYKVTILSWLTLVHFALIYLPGRSANLAGLQHCPGMLYNRSEKKQQFSLLHLYYFRVRSTKAYIPPERKIPGVGGWRLAMPPTPDFCVTQRKIYQHVGIFWRYPRRQSPTPILKFALSPMPNPDASQWNIGGVGLSGVGAGVGHVHFMLFMSFSFASGTQRKLVFQWNMGFRPTAFEKLWTIQGE